MNPVTQLRQFSILGTLLLALIAMPFLSLQAQQAGEQQKRVKIKITTAQDGKVEEIEETITVEEDMEIDEILEKYNLEGELGEMAEDEVVEITIKRKKEDVVLDDLTIELDEINRNFHFEGVSERPFLGVYPADLTVEKASELDLENSEGAYLTKVVENSAASEAGLQAGDVITHIGEQAVTDEQSLREAIRAHQPGDEVEITYWRDDKQQTTVATFQEHHFKHHPGRAMQWRFNMPEFPERPFLGITLEESLEADEQSEGIKVGRVIDNTTAKAMDLQPGDVIKTVNGKPVNTLDGLKKALYEGEIGEMVTVGYERDGQKKESSAPLKGRSFGDCHRSLDEKEIEKCVEKMVQGMSENFDGQELAEMMENLDQHLGDLQERLKELDIEVDVKVKGLQEDLEEEMEAVEKEIRQTRIVIRMENLSAGKAAELSEETGEQIEANNTLAIEDFHFSPNPNKGQFKLSFHLPEKGKTTVRIFDAQNKPVYEETLNRFQGDYEQEIDISGNAKGLYILHVIQGERSFAKQIILQ